MNVETARENKAKSKKAPPCGKKWKLLAAFYVSVCQCIQLFSMFHSVCGSVLTSIVIECLYQY